jgi:hypothetical protein
MAFRSHRAYIYPKIGFQEKWVHAHLSGRAAGGERALLSRLLQLLFFTVTAPAAKVLRPLAGRFH